MKKKWLGWHWLDEDRRLQYGDKTKVRTGQTLTATGPLKMCRNGMHASQRALDALGYAPGPIACRVELIGERIDDENKSVARSRRVLWMVDATKVLHEFACWCAEQALRRQRKEGREPDARFWEAIRVKRRWLRGLATDKELSAAYSAAESAAESAVHSAAESAAESAVHSAAESAADSAAYSAADSAADSAAESAQNAKLEAMLNSLHRKRVK